jgi:Zn-dependent protease with chaperone function
VPDALRAALSDAELAAIVAHEHGHVAHRHAIVNLTRRCVLLPHSTERARQQELQADQYAADRGHAAALASALRKLSRAPFDVHRAARLERVAEPFPAPGRDA